MGPFVVSSSFVKTTSLLHIADTFPYKLLSSTPTTLPHPGPLIPAAWEKLLSKHPDRLYAHTIVQIICFGVRIGYTGPDQHIISPNLPSANDSVDTLNSDLQDQKNHRRIMRVPTPQPGDRFISSPLGLVPKAGQIKAWRRIHHLSFPHGKSVNDHITPDWGALEYAFFELAVAMVATAGQGAILMKRDLAV